MSYGRLDTETRPSVKLKSYPTWMRITGSLLRQGLGGTRYYFTASSGPQVTARGNIQTHSVFMIVLFRHLRPTLSIVEKAPFL